MDRLLLLSLFSIPSEVLLLHIVYHDYTYCMVGVLPLTHHGSILLCLMMPITSAEKCSVQSSHSAISDPLQSHGLQYAKLPCPSPTPRAFSNSFPLSQWCHPTISSSVVPFSSCLQSFLARKGSFLVSHFFTSGGQSIGASVSASVLPMNLQDRFPLGLTGLILQSKRLSRVSSNTTVQKYQFFGAQLYLKKKKKCYLPEKKRMWQPPSHQSLQSSAMVHPEETQDGKVKDTGPG